MMDRQEINTEHLSAEIYDVLIKVFGDQHYCNQATDDVMKLVEKRIADRVMPREQKRCMTCRCAVGGSVLCIDCASYSNWQPKECVSKQCSGAGRVIPLRSAEEEINCPKCGGSGVGDTDGITYEKCDCVKKEGV
jgi:hypothetical protein